MVAVLDRVEEYISLTDEKSNREYNKFFAQRSRFENVIEMICKNNYSAIVYPIVFENDITIFYPRSEASFISNADISDIINLKLRASSVVICRQKEDIKISITVEKEKLLTLSEAYDIFKSQKGSSDT